MERTELIKLKLQMGLSPAVDIDPRILRAMWRQLCRERGLARRPLQPAAPPVIALIHPAASS
jgi:hypothetical protein